MQEYYINVVHNCPTKGVYRFGMQAMAPTSAQAIEMVRDLINPKINRSELTFTAL